MQFQFSLADLILAEIEVQSLSKAKNYHYQLSILKI